MVQPLAAAAILVQTVPLPLAAVLLLQPAVHMVLPLAAAKTEKALLSPFPAVLLLPLAVKYETEQKALNIQQQYQALTEHEKSLVSVKATQKLQSLLDGFKNYSFTAGDNNSWTLGLNGSLTFTVNGAFAKFSGIQVDGIAVDSSCYTVKSGSTIITLQADYLNTLAVGNHPLTVLYTDGQVQCNFVVLAAPQPETPSDTTGTSPSDPGNVTSAVQTGDSTNIALWVALFLCGIALSSFCLLRRNKNTK